MQLSRLMKLIIYGEWTNSSQIFAQSKQKIDCNLLTSTIHSSAQTKASNNTINSLALKKTSSTSQ